MFSGHEAGTLMWHLLPKCTAALFNIKFIDTNTFPCSIKLLWWILAKYTLQRCYEIQYNISPDQFSFDELCLLKCTVDTCTYVKSRCAFQYHSSLHTKNAIPLQLILLSSKGNMCRIWECRRKRQSNFSVWSWITADLSLELQTHQTCHCHKYRGQWQHTSSDCLTLRIKEDLSLRSGQKSNFGICVELWESCDSFTVTVHLALMYQECIEVRRSSF